MEHPDAGLYAKSLVSGWRCLHRPSGFVGKDLRATSEPYPPYSTTTWAFHSATGRDTRRPRNKKIVN